jgi:hypothetical protein
MSIFPFNTVHKQNKAASKKKAPRKKKLIVTECIDLAGKNSEARVTLEGMSTDNKLAVDQEIGKTLKAKINKELKGTILNVVHRKQLELLNIEYLTKSVVEMGEMPHSLKPTLEQLLRTEHAFKVGDWCEVLYEYTPGTCSDGGVGTITAISKDDNDKVWCTVTYVLDKRVETHIDPNRITVTIMLGYNFKKPIGT